MLLSELLLTVRSTYRLNVQNIYLTHTLLHEWLFHMKFVKRALFSYEKITCVELFIMWPFKVGYYPFKKNIISIGNHIADLDIVTDVTCYKMLLHVCSYDF